jgi:nanoRNase/pAp phosphatase (c-di-AMP/oligoRNAs hydrolase)
MLKPSAGFTMNAEESSLIDTQLEQLGAVVKGFKRVLLIPHDFPDPDALASAAALHLLLKKKWGVHGQIAFSGEVSRAENKELLRRMKFRWHRMDDLRRVPRWKKIPCILIDTAPWSRNVSIPHFAHPIGVFDHHQHPKWREGKHAKLFADIRGGAGATTTITFEYLKNAGIEIPRWLAAIMAYAIISETLDLSRDCEENDRQAYLELAARADHRIIGRVRHAPLPRAYFGHVREAIEKAKQAGPLVFTHLENVGQPEIVAEIADLLMRMEGVRWSFCTANINDGVYVSMRSRQRGARCSRILRSAMGKNGSAGGHMHIAAGFFNPGAGTWAEREGRRQTFVRALVRKIVRSAPEDPDQFDHFVHALLAPLEEEKSGTKQLKLEWN